MKDEMSDSCGSVLTIYDNTNDLYSTYESRYVWEDWMLEDEVVTEEKQQVNKIKKIWKQKK